MMGLLSYALVGGLAVIAALVIAAIDRRLLRSRQGRCDD